jgi:hypothetical protein
MSWEAVAWAMKQPVGHSPAKFVLVAIAERAGKENTAWPSVSALVEATCQNRKTVLANMQRLVEMGYLIDTGERTGQTKSVVVYRLNEPESSPKINTAKQSQNLPVAVPKDTPLSDTCFGTACEDEAVPKSTASSPKKPLKQSQKLLEAVPKSSTEPSEPPLGTTIEPPKAGVEIPEWLPAEHWAMWNRFRTKKDSKAWTDDARRLSLGTLGKLKDEGHDPKAVIEQSIERGWTGLFPLKTNKSFGRPAPQPENFKEKTYVGTDESSITWA